MDAKDEKKIWSILMDTIGNPYGVAGLMGNLFAESSMSPVCATGKFPQQTVSQYVADIKNGKTSPESFAHDGVAFGLAQWRYWSRKEAMLNFTGASMIDDPEAQTKFLLSEIRTYTTVWKTLLNATSVREASDMVMLRYERPSGTSEAAMAKRASYGQRYYDKYADEKKTPMVVTTADKVNLRAGDGLSYSSVGRAEKSGAMYEWVATAPNGWFAVRLKDRVAWISGSFAQLTEQ